MNHYEFIFYRTLIYKNGEIEADRGSTDLGIPTPYRFSEHGDKPSDSFVRFYYEYTFAMNYISNDKYEEILKQVGDIVFLINPTDYKTYGRVRVDMYKVSLIG